MNCMCEYVYEEVIVIFGQKYCLDPRIIIWWVLVVIPLLPSIWFEEKQGWDFFLPLCIYFYVIDLYFSFFLANIYIYIYIYISLFFVSYMINYIFGAYILINPIGTSKRKWKLNDRLYMDKSKPLSLSLSLSLSHSQMRKG